MPEHFHTHRNIEEEHHRQNNTNTDALRQHIDDGVDEGLAPRVAEDDWVSGWVRFLQRRIAKSTLMNSKVRIISWSRVMAMEMLA